MQKSTGSENAGRAAVAEAGSTHQKNTGKINTIARSLLTVPTRPRSELFHVDRQAGLNSGRDGAMLISVKLVAALSLVSACGLAGAKCIPVRVEFGGAVLVERAALYSAALLIEDQKTACRAPDGAGHYAVILSASSEKPETQGPAFAVSVALGYRRSDGKDAHPALLWSEPVLCRSDAPEECSQVVAGRVKRLLEFFDK